MNDAPVIVKGMVKPDGTLELEEALNLPAGRVRVHVQPASARKEDWWQFLQRCRAELEASGARFRPGLEIAAAMDQIRGEHERVDALYWEMDWQKQHPGDAAC